MKIYQFPLYLARWGERFTCPIPVKCNPYYGCSHKCSYCFSMQMRKPNQPDRSKTVVPGSVESVRKLLEQSFNGDRNKSYLHQCLRMKIPVQMGVLTDPFMAEEREHRCTYKMLELFREFDYPVIITTKGIVCGDSDYINLLKSMKVIVQFSINTLDHKLSKKLESNAPAPLSRIRVMELLVKAGITTQLRLDPIIPMITDNFIDMAEVINRAWGVGASDVIVRYLKIFNFKRFYERINGALGFDYMEHLKKNGYPLEKEHDYYRTASYKMKDEMWKLKRLTESYGMGFYNPIFLGMQDFKPCCGFESHFGSVGSPWALYSHANQIDSETTIHDYLEGTECPYSEQFERLWNGGGLERFFSDLKYDNKKGTYNRIKQEVL